MKFPTPNDPAIPLCFGLGYQTADRMCLRCPVRSQCSDVCLRWVDRRSLAELLADVEKATSATFEIDTEMDADELYARLYQKHYGRRPRPDLFRSKRWRAWLNKAETFCEEKDIDLSVWMTAQMHGMKKWIMAQRKTNKRIAFQPNMLVGEKAFRRYEIYRAIARRRFKQARDTTMDSDTEIGKFIEALLDGEEVVGGYYVAARVAGDRMSWEQAIEETSPPSLWKMIRGGMKDKEYRRWFLATVNRYSVERIHQWRWLARVRAMVNVARHYNAILPDRIGVDENPTWDGIAALLARLYAGPKLQVNGLEGVTGTVWRFDGEVHRRYV